MHQVEAVASKQNRRLLILDTQTDSLAYQLYLNLGYQKVGEIPCFALSTEGELEATCVFYKQLDWWNSGVLYMKIRAFEFADFKEVTDIYQEGIDGTSKW